MADATFRLSLPFIAAAQAQKHVTHNEALMTLDALVQLSVAARLATPPAAPAAGSRYLVTAAPTGAFAGKAGNVAAYDDDAWRFLAPRAGWMTFIEAETLVVVFDGTAWNDLQTRPPTILGVNATADVNNRLSVASPAVLFNHAGAGSQLKINKAAAADTASLLFQTGFSGRAEFGLAGSDFFQVKVSADGATWRTALAMDPATGNVGIGTATPGFRLDVSGNMRVDGSAAFAGLSLRNTKSDAIAVSYIDAPNRNNTPDSHIYFRHLTTGGSEIRLGTQTAGTFADRRVDRLVVDATGAVLPGADNSATFGASGFRWSAVWAASGVIQTSDIREKVVESVLEPAKAARMVAAVDPILFRWRVGGSVVEVIEDGVEIVEEPETRFVERVRESVEIREGAPVRISEIVVEEQPAFDLKPLIDENGTPVTQVVPQPGGGETIGPVLHPVPRVTRVERPVTRPITVQKPGQRLHAGFSAQAVKAAMDDVALDFGAWGLADKDDPDSQQFLRPDQLIPVLWAALQDAQARLAKLEGAARP